MAIEDASLQGVVLGTDGRKMVIINSDLMHEGDTIGEFTVLQIKNNEVIVRFKNNEHKLKLYK